MAGSMYVGSTFNPFSYQEMYTPVHEATEAHQNVEDQEAQLQSLSDQWDSKLNNTDDVDLKKQYQGYLDNLKQASDSLLANGLSPVTRNQLAQLKSGYATTIVPIETAYKDRQAAAAELNKLHLLDPSLMIKEDLSKVGLSKFIANPNYTTDVYSGNMLTKQVADKAQYLRGELQKNPHNWKGILSDEFGPQYYERMMQRGMTSKQIEAFMHDPKSSPILNDIVQSTVNSSGIPTWGNDAMTARALEYAKQGVYPAIGTIEDKTLGRDRSMAIWRAQQRELQMAQDKGSIPVNQSHFDVNAGTGQEVASLINKLYTKEGYASSDAWGKNASINPMKQYEEAKNFKQSGVKEYNDKLQQIRKNNLLPGIVLREGNGGVGVPKGMLYFADKDGNPATLPGNLQKQVSALTHNFNRQAYNSHHTILNESEYNHMINAGLNSNSTFKEARTALGQYQNLLQKTYTTSEIPLSEKGYENVDRMIQNDLTSGTGRLIKVNDKFSTEDNESADIDDYQHKYNSKKGNNIRRIEVDPHNKGIIITNQHGDQFKWIPGNNVFRKSIEKRFSDNSTIGQLQKLVDNPKTPYQQRIDAAQMITELNNKNTHDEFSGFLTGRDTYIEYPETGKNGGQGFEQ